MYYTIKNRESKDVTTKKQAFRLAFFIYFEFLFCKHQKSQNLYDIIISAAINIGNKNEGHITADTVLTTLFSAVL